MAKPKIRFKGYTDDWEQRKLGELYSILTERNTDLLPYNRTLSVATMTYKTDGNGAADSSLANYKRLRIGDIAFEGHTSKEFRYGRFVLNDAGDGIMSPRFSALRPYTQMPTTFWKYYIHYEPIMRKVLVNSTKAGTMMNELVVDEFLKSSLYVPSKEEQACIGGYFTTLDHLITLHQRKCEETKKLKKYMLQKMFPQNGQTVPEIRFVGFTDAWEQRKFSEGVSEIGDGLHGTPIYCEDGNVYFINGNNLVDGKIVISAETKKVNESQQSTADKSLDDTTILMSINGTIGNLAYYSGERLMLGKSAAYIKVSEFDKRFVYAYLQAPSVQGYFMDSLTGTTIKNLGLKAIREMIMFIPQDVDEQKRIGKFFDYLDHLITLHQHKCEELQNMKKFMLQNMFV